MQRKSRETVGYARAPAFTFQTLEGCSDIEEFFNREVEKVEKV
jgi:hypothetical protein